MDKLYRETKTGLMEISDLLEKFENALAQEASEAIKLNIVSKLNGIHTACDQLDIYVTKEPASRKYDAKIKVDQLKYDLQHFRAAFNSIQYKK